MCVIAVALFAVLYRQSLFLAPVGDDWMILGPVKALRLLHGFWGGLLDLFQYRLYDFYRPLAMLPLYLGYEHLPVVQLIRLIIVIAQAGLVFRLCRAVSLSQIASAIAGAAVLLHQVGVAVYLQHDLWGDILGGFGLLGMLLLAVAYHDQRLSLTGYVWGSVVITAVTLLAKESGLSALLIPAAVAWALRASRQLWRAHLVATAAIALVIAAYLAYRLHLGFPPNNDPDSYYALRLGPNVLLNVILVVAGTVNPMNTVDVYLTGGLWRIAAALWVGGLVLLCSFSLWHGADSRSRRLVIVLSILSVAALGPVLLMPRAHEANVVRCLLFLIPAIAACIHGLWKQVGLAWKTALAGLVVCWFMFDISAVQAKVGDLVAASQQAARFRHEMLTFQPTLASDHLSILVEWPEKRGYNLYRRPLYSELRYGELEYGLSFIYDRPTLSVNMQLVGSLDSAATAVINADFAIGVDGNPKQWPALPRDDK